MNGRLVNWLHDGEEVVEAICRSLKFGYLRLREQGSPQAAGTTSGLA